MKRLLFTAILLFLIGCASIGIPISKNNAHIVFPHYSIMVPPDSGWHLSIPNEVSETAIITQKIGHPMYATLQMTFLKNDVIDESRKSWPAKQVADEYRNLEKQTMLEQGVHKGRYNLSNVVMSEETIGDKIFFTMKYTTSTNTIKESASLYIFFPKEENNPYFLVIHYSESAPHNVFMADAFYQEFIETLKSLRIQT